MLSELNLHKHILTLLSFVTNNSLSNMQDDNYQHQQQQHRQPYPATPPTQPSHLGNAVNSPAGCIQSSSLWSQPISPIDYQHSFVISRSSYTEPTQEPAAGPFQSHANPFPQRPHISQHSFTEPYIAPPHPPSQQTCIWQTPQFVHPYEGAPPKENMTTNSLLTLPNLLPRPTSAPPSRIEQVNDTNPY